MRGLLIAAQVDELVAVADNAFPLLLKQGLELRHVLNDDRDRNLAGAHGGEQLVKLIGQRHVRKLIHDKVNVDG